MTHPRILIINPFGIGDVIFSTPLIETLKHSFSGSYIGYICNKRAYAVIRSNPDLKRIFIYEKDDYRAIWQRSKLECLKKIWDFLKEIKNEKFDTLIDLSLNYQYSLLLKFAGIKRRIGLNYRNRGRFLTDKINIDGFEDKHVIEYYLDILKLLNINSDDYVKKPRIYISKRDMLWAEDFLKDNGVKNGDLVIGVVPGCGASWGLDARYRRWDKRNFAKVCDEIMERYQAKIILFGDQKETGICSDVETHMKHKPILACGKTGLGDFFGLLNRCKLIVTNDGGPLHMAVGVGVKTVSIFGPVDENIYGPYPPSPDHIVISKKDIPCRPCYKKFKYIQCDNRKCLDSITTEDALNAVQILLSSEKGVRV